MSAEPESKKLKLTEAEVGDEELEQDPKVLAAIEEINNVQTDLDGLNDKASEEILQVERKYNKLREPLYAKRASDIQAIQGFWVTAFLNHPQISSLLSEEDEKALAFMDNLTVKENEDIKSGYKIIFKFKENPYFTNTEIEKEIKITDDGEMAGTVTKIDWKAGQSLVNNEEVESFFRWFTSDSSGQDELGELLKEDIWPNPLQFYLDNEDAEDDEEGDFGEEDDDEEEDEENGAN